MTFRIHVLFLGALCCGSAYPQTTQVVLNRSGSTITLEPYAPNIVRVTLSKSREEATAPPGYGFVASPSTEGWQREDKADGTRYSSPRMVVTVEPTHSGKLVPTQIDISKFFVGSAPPAHIDFSTPGGKTFLKLEGWWMSVPNYKDGDAGILHGCFLTFTRPLTRLMKPARRI